MLPSTAHSPLLPPSLLSSSVISLGSAASVLVCTRSLAPRHRMAATSLLGPNKDAYTCTVRAARRVAMPKAYFVSEQCRSESMCVLGPPFSG